jgi:DNA polymerase/3'-5' exonuclease PolX
MTQHIAYQLTPQLVQELSPGCTRIDIAGSLLRGKETPSDIEIVAIPSLGEFQIKDMFDLVVDTIPINRLDDALNELYQRGVWALHLKPETGKPYKNGPHQKKLVHVPTGVLCDLFITSPRQWAYTYVIRTGPADFSHALVTRALNLGMFFDGCLLHSHAPVVELVQGKREVQPCPLGDQCPHIIEIADERAFFAALRLAYLAPAERSRIDPYTILRA